MSNSIESTGEKREPTLRQQIKTLEDELSARIITLQEEYGPKLQALREKDREERAAAIALARGDRLLMSWGPTKYVLEHDGKTADGRDVGDIGDYLADMRARLEKDPPYLSTGDTPRAWNELSPDVTGTPHKEEK